MKKYLKLKVDKLFKEKKPYKVLIRLLLHITKIETSFKYFFIHNS